MAVLEPDKFLDYCVRRPEEWDSWRTKASKEWRDDQRAAGLEVMDDKDADTVERIVAAVSEHTDAQDLLRGTRREETIEWNWHGVRCKGRVDAIASDRIVDLKTTRDLGLFVRRGAAELLYHGQLAWYLDGAIEAGACSPDAAAYVVAVESTEPYDVAAFRLGEQSLDAGRALYSTLLERWITCRDADLWPGRYPSLTTLDMPGWAAGMRQEDEEEF
jgi:hypothetical protein